MTNTKAPRIALLAGTGRLGIVSGLFTFFAAYGAFASIELCITILRPPIELPSSKLLFGVAGLLSFSFGCLRTSWLLDRRRKEGIAAAVILSAAPLFGTLVGAPPPTLPVIGISSAILLLLGSVWHRLDG